MRAEGSHVVSTIEQLLWVHLTAAVINVTCYLKVWPKQLSHQLKRCPHVFQSLHRPYSGGQVIYFVLML